MIAATPSERPTAFRTTVFHPTSATIGSCRSRRRRHRRRRRRRCALANAASTRTAPKNGRFATPRPPFAPPVPSPYPIAHPRPAFPTGRLPLPPQRARVQEQLGRVGLPVPPSDNGPGAALQLRLLAVPDRSRVQGEARVQAQDRQVREEGAEEAREAAQVPEEVGQGRRRRVHEPQDAAQVPDVVRPLWLTVRRPRLRPRSSSQTRREYRVSAPSTGDGIWDGMVREARCLNARGESTRARGYERQTHTRRLVCACVPRLWTDLIKHKNSPVHSSPAPRFTPLSGSFQLFHRALGAAARR